MRTAIVAILLLVSAANSQEIEATVSPSAPNVFYATTPQWTMRVEVITPVVYVPTDGESTYYGFLGDLDLKQNDKIVDYAGGYFNTEPKPLPLIVKKASIGVEIEAVKGGIGNRYTFKKMGQAIIKISIGDVLINIPITVKNVPIKTGVTGDEAIAKFGFPVKDRHIIDWPDTKSFNDMIYSPEAGDLIAVEHWLFKDFPNCFFAVNEDNIVENIHACEPTSASYRESLKWRGFDDGLKLADDIRNRGNDLDRMEKENREQEEQEARNFREWRGKNGSEVIGKFVRLKATTVEIELRNGKKNTFRITALVDEDAELVRKLAKADKASQTK